MRNHAWNPYCWWLNSRSSWWNPAGASRWRRERPHRDVSWRNVTKGCRGFHPTGRGLSHFHFNTGLSLTKGHYHTFPENKEQKGIMSKTAVWLKWCLSSVAIYINNVLLVKIGLGRFGMPSIIIYLVFKGLLKPSINQPTFGWIWDIYATYALILDISMLECDFGEFNYEILI